MTTRKLVAIDLDGTLLGADSKISNRSIAILQEVAKKGHIIILSSGRPPRSMMETYKALKLTTPLIAYNGALIKHPLDPSFLGQANTFSKEKIICLFHQINNIVTSFVSEDETSIAALHFDAYLDKYFPFTGMETKYGNIDHDLSFNPFTCIMGCDKEIGKKVEVIAEELGYSYRHWRDSAYCELHIPGVGKGSSLRYVQSLLGFSKEDTIAFGDSDNDFEMLQEAALAFTMKNSRSPLLLSNFPTTEKSNAEDGVALTLKSILL